MRVLEVRSAGELPRVARVAAGALCGHGWLCRLPVEVRRGGRMSEVRIPLSEAIEALRSELLTAMRVGSPEELKFGVGPVEMEFQLEATKGAEADAGVRFWLFSAGGKGSYSSASTHRVKLTLAPVTVTGGEVKVTSFVTGEIG